MSSKLRVNCERAISAETESFGGVVVKEKKFNYLPKKISLQSFKVAKKYKLKIRNSNRLEDEKHKGDKA